MTITNSRCRSALLGKLGAAGFAFFLLKGMLWLLLPFLFARFIQ